MQISTHELYMDHKHIINVINGSQTHHIHHKTHHIHHKWIIKHIINGSQTHHIHHKTHHKNVWKSYRWGVMLCLRGQGSTWIRICTWKYMIYDVFYDVMMCLWCVLWSIYDVCYDPFMMYDVFMIYVMCFMI